MRGLVLVGVAVVGFWGCNINIDNSNPETDAEESNNQSEQAAVDPDLEKVRKYLRENLNSGKWEEVRWWTGRPMEKMSADSESTLISIIESKKELLNNPLLKPSDIAKLKSNVRKLESKLRETRSIPTPKGARLKYRTKNAFGGMQLHDQVFFIYDDHAELAETDPRLTAVLVSYGDFADD